MKTVALLVVMVIVVGIEARKENKYCAKDLCKEKNDHTMCKFRGPSKDCVDRGLHGVSEEEQEEIVNVHNKLRSKVASGEQDGQPTASNMRQMSWDNELAKIAQRWADQCIWGHDSCRNVKRFQAGQNAYKIPVFEAGTKADWPAAVQYWYDEVDMFDPNNISPFVYDGNTGHYTQLVWADTYLVGCGFTQYKGDDGWYQSLQICNYGPSGNADGADMYKEGVACTDCIPGTTVCQDNLCV